MNTEFSSLRGGERAQLELRSLYSAYGYKRYKMSKFEEYDLYARNKDFLVSDRVITFTDTNGKLMALKPDVTLSIIRNSGDVEGCVSKLYYNENVYRVSKGNGVFGEIMQTGLECIGDIDDYSVFEVIMLAAESLKRISENYVLDISHMGIIEYALESTGLTSSAYEKLLECIGRKNAHELREICSSHGADTSLLELLVGLHGSAARVLPTLNAQLPNCSAVRSLAKLIESLEAYGFAGHINIDFSVTGNARYYNGFVFNGFIGGVCERVLSGGQYDKLMNSMGRNSRAIGFAIYLDLLDALYRERVSYDADCVILYDETTPLDIITSIARERVASGEKCTVLRQLPSGFKYKKMLRLSEGSVEIIEGNA